MDDAVDCVSQRVLKLVAEVVPDDDDDVAARPGALRAQTSMVGMEIAASIISSIGIICRAVAEGPRTGARACLVD